MPDVAQAGASCRAQVAHAEHSTRLVYGQFGSVQTDGGRNLQTDAPKLV